MEKENGAKGINYYEILHRLKDYTCKLIEAGAGLNDVITVQDFMHIELLTAEIKSYIFDVDILKKEFEKRKTDIKKQLDTDDHKNKAIEAYAKLKEYAKSITPENYKLIYPANKSLGLISLNEIEGYIALDKAKLYYYPSIVLIFRVLQHNNKNLSTLKLEMYNGLKYFYHQFDKLKFLFKLKKVEFPYDDIKIPDDLEFLALTDLNARKDDFIKKINLSETSKNLERFALYFILSCLWYVLAELTAFIQEKLNNPTLPLADDSLKERLEILRKYPKLCAIWDYVTVSTRIKDIATQFNISEPTVYKRIKKITGILTGIKDGSINTLIKLKFKK